MNDIFQTVSERSTTIESITQDFPADNGSDIKVDLTTEGGLMLSRWDSDNFEIDTVIANGNPDIVTVYLSVTDE